MITPDQAMFLSWLVGTIGVRKAIEVGVFTGYSSTAIAMALPENGQLVALETDPEPLELAKTAWKTAEVESKIDLQIGPADVSLAKLVKESPSSFDFVFIDADKAGYDNYYEAALKLVRVGGVVALDNMLWYGKVADPTDSKAATLTLRSLNDKMAADPRIHFSLVPIGDGLALCRRLK